MLKKSLTVLVPAMLLSMSSAASAQVFSYFGCKLESASAFENALTRLHEEMAGGVRPTFSLDEDVWNGSSENTHTLLVEHTSYQALEAFQSRIADTPSAQLVIGDSSAFAECHGDGLAIERGFWGDRDGEWDFYAVLPIMTSNPALYAEEFGQFASSQIEGSTLEGIGLYESRAGGDGANFFVGIGASSMSVLNEFLDTLPQSDDFADFVEEVASIRTVGPASQKRRLRIWEP